MGTYSDDSEHVLEGHVGDADEKRSVDVHNSILVIALAKINQSNHQGHHLNSIFVIQVGKENLLKNVNLNYDTIGVF